MTFIKDELMDIVAVDIYWYDFLDRDSIGTNNTPNKHQLED